MDGPAGDLDRISALSDDLLHVILSFLGDARDVTRTAVLSRRWRHVWVHAKNLTFSNDGDLTNNAHFAGFVDWVLAKRGDVDMESLKIHFYGKGYTSPEQVNEWLRYAARCVVRSVDVNLDVPTDQQQAVELPSHGRARSILLSLARHSRSRVQLPAAAAASYQALTELRLVAPVLSEEVTGGTLGDFVTSCCPCLRRLSVKRPKGLPRLVLRSELLEDLDIFWAHDLRTLDVAAPSLRIISLRYCFHNIWSSEEDHASKVARIVAPRLQEFCFQHYKQIPQLDLDIVHGLTSVRRLHNLVLDMHGRYCGDTQVGLSLLAKCPGVQDVHVSLDHREADVPDEGDLVDLSTEGVAANFGNVKSMVLNWAVFFPTRHFVSSIASFLMRCSRLRSLCINSTSTTKGAPRMNCFCDNHDDKWKFHGNIALKMLEEVIITGFTGADEEMQLLSLLFEGSNSIKCMAISETARKINIAVLTQKIGQEVESNNTILQKLMKVPCADGGQWHFVEQVFVWTCYAI